MEVSALASRKLVSSRQGHFCTPVVPTYLRTISLLLIDVQTQVIFPFLSPPHFEMKTTEKPSFCPEWIQECCPLVPLSGTSHQELDEFVIATKMRWNQFEDSKRATETAP